MYKCYDEKIWIKYVINFMVYFFENIFNYLQHALPGHLIGVTQKYEAYIITFVIKSVRCYRTRPCAHATTISPKYLAIVRLNSSLSQFPAQPIAVTVQLYVLSELH